MNYKKISKELFDRGYVDERMIICHSYRSYTNTKDYYIVSKYTNFKSTFYLPSFMILSIKDNTLNISYAKMFGGFKKYYASFDICDLKFIEEITVDKAVKIYKFKINANNEEQIFYIIGIKNKDNVKELVNHLINNSSILNKNKFEISGIPEFKYISSRALKQIFTYNTRNMHCQCCGKISEYLYQGAIYCEEDIERLCPECIISGKAANDFDGIFIDIEGVTGIDENELEILNKKTPGYDSYQDVRWSYCCNSPSKFYGILTWSDIVKIGIEKEVKKAILNNEDYKEFVKYDGDFKEFIEMNEDEAVQIAIYKCKKCGKISVQIYFD